MSEQRLIHNAQTGEQQLVDIDADEIARRDAWNYPTAAYQRARADVEMARRAAYAVESDPLFFEWQRGDGTEQAWLNAVAAVKAAHPYPPEP